MISSHDTHPPVSVDSPGVLPAVTALLGVWDQLNLELGDAVIVTDGHPWSPLAALVATWYGAVPVLLLTKHDATMPPGVAAFVSDESPDSAKVLGEALRGYPRVAALELSGRSEMTDLLFEGLPAYSRLMLAGTARESLTIDYYVNVHRKGLTVVSTILDTEARSAGNDAVAERARRLLGRPERAAACRAALAGRPLSR